MTPLMTFLAVVLCIAVELLTFNRLLPQTGSHPANVVDAPVCLSSTPCQALLACPTDVCLLSDAPAPHTPLPHTPTTTCAGGIIGWVAHWLQQGPHALIQSAAEATPAHHGAHITRPAWAVWADDACSISTRPRTPASLTAAAQLTHTPNPSLLAEGWSVDAASGAISRDSPASETLNTEASSEQPALAGEAAPSLDTPAVDLPDGQPADLHSSLTDAQQAAAAAEAAPPQEPLVQSPTAPSTAARTLHQLAASVSGAAAAALQAFQTNDIVVRLYGSLSATSPALVATAAAVTTAAGVAGILYLLSARNKQTRPSARRSSLRAPSSDTPLRVSFADIQAAAIAILPVSPLRFLTSPARSPHDDNEAVASDVPETEEEGQHVAVADDVDTDEGQPDTANDQDNKAQTPVAVADAKARRSAALRAMTDVVQRKTAAPSPRAPRSSRAAPKIYALDDRIDSPVVYADAAAPSPAGGRVLRVRNTVRYT